MRAIRSEEAHRAFATFDAWVARATARALTTSADVASAAAFLRRLDLPLRTPDALNIAIAQRVGVEILTFDKKMAVSARVLAQPSLSHNSPSKWEAPENTHRGFFCITPVGGLGVGATLHEM
jgi:uncharacterized protein